MRLRVKRKSLFLLLLGLAAQARMGVAQSADTLTRTGDMTTRRVGHTATLLWDGMVLIAGGQYLDRNAGGSTSTTQSTAELYDPSTGTFKQTGTMTTSRYGQTATLLLDGRVLIAGGQGGDPADASRFLVAWSAELYDPKSRTFTRAGYMTAARRGHFATLLRDGRVLIVGGALDYSGYRSAEIYDPSTGTFTATGKMSEESADTATLLPNGKVLVSEYSVCFCINLGDEPVVTNSSELFDPLNGTFTRTGGVGATRWRARATLLIDGRVLVSGGVPDYYDVLATAELYDPSSAAFAVTGAMTTARSVHSATLLPDGSVFLARGWPLSQAGITSELFDPVKGTFRPASPMDSPRDSHTSTLLKDGTALIAGGTVQIDANHFPDALSSAEIYHPPVLVPTPALLTLSGGGGQGAILHAGTSRVVSSTDPAVAGELLEIYCTGLADGGAVPPLAAVGGHAAEVLYFGKSGIAGVNQINVRVPSGVVPGGAVSVRMHYLGRPSNEVTIGSR